MIQQKSFSYLVLMDKVGWQSDVTPPYLSDRGRLSSPWQQASDPLHLMMGLPWKRDLSVLTASETNEVLLKYCRDNLFYSVSMLQVPLLSPPEPPHFTTLKAWAFITWEKDFKSWLAPKLGAGMPWLIWMETHVHMGVHSLMYISAYGKRFCLFINLLL